jgi:hypothetical protein
MKETVFKAKLVDTKKATRTNVIFTEKGKLRIRKNGKHTVVIGSGDNAETIRIDTKSFNILTNN